MAASFSASATETKTVPSRGSLSPAAREALANAAGKSPPTYYELHATCTDAVYGTASIVHSLVGIPVVGWTSDEI